MMTELELENIVNYYLDLEQDLANTSRYIEPEGQENVYSFEFRKLIILACTEIENVCKALCEVIEPDAERGNMNHYKAIILKQFPKIVEAETHISRWHKTIRPFEGWDTGKLEWWSVNQEIKHDRGANFNKATYKTAVYAISALYIMIAYLSKLTGIDVPYYSGDYITSHYGYTLAYFPTGTSLPDFSTS